MDTNTGKVCKTKLLKYKNCLILLIILIENKTEHNLKWPYIPDHPYRMLIVGDFVSGKINALLNLIKNQAELIKYIYLYAKDAYEAKYQYLINKREKVGLSNMMILKFLLHTQFICKMFIKILKNIIQEWNAKC